MLRSCYRATYMPDQPRVVRLWYYCETTYHGEPKHVRIDIDAAELGRLAENAAVNSDGHAVLGSGAILARVVKTPKVVA